MKSTGTTCKRHEQEVYDMLLEYSTKWNTRISLDALPPDQAGHRKFKVELLSCDEETFEAVCKGAFIVDIREDYEIAIKKFSVPNIIKIPNSTFTENFSELPKDKPIIIADSVGLRSKKIVKFLIDNGYSLVANLNGGIVDWEKDKLPMNIDKDELLTGSCLCHLRPKKKFKNKN